MESCESSSKTWTPVLVSSSTVGPHSSPKRRGNGVSYSASVGRYYAKTDARSYQREKTGPPVCSNGTLIGHGWRPIVHRGQESDDSASKRTGKEEWRDQQSGP